MIFWRIRIPYLPLTEWWVLRITKMYCKAFYVCYQMACIMLIMLVLLLAHSSFGKPFWELFWSISQTSIWSIHHKNDNWPISFGDLALNQSKLFCFLWRLTKSHLGSFLWKIGQFAKKIWPPCSPYLSNLPVQV